MNGLGYCIFSSPLLPPASASHVSASCDGVHSSFIVPTKLHQQARKGLCPFAASIWVSSKDFPRLLYCAQTRCSLLLPGPDH